jgi:REP element-mobilizing transposase RayT
MSSPAPNRERQRPAPASYLITFSCYGTFLHGQEGTVDRTHNRVGSPTLEADAVRLTQSQARMRQPPYSLDGVRRNAVLEGLKTACDRRGWSLLAAHVRTTHVHAVVQADSAPEEVMNSLKAYATRALNEAGLDCGLRRRWARHGSTRYLWSREKVRAAVDYVVARQGDEMAVFCCAS